MVEKPSNTFAIIFVFIHNLLCVGIVIRKVLGESYVHGRENIELDLSNDDLIIIVFVLFCVLNVFGLSGYKAEHMGDVIFHSLILCLASIVFSGFMVFNVLNEYDLDSFIYLGISGEGLVASVIGLYYSQKIIDYNWIDNQEFSLVESLISGKCANCKIDTNQVVSFTNEGIVLCYDCVLNIKVLPNNKVF